MFEGLHRVFGTAKWRRKEAARIARERFSSYAPDTATVVLDILVQELGINFEQLNPGTRLAEDLGADEEEPYSLTLWLEEVLKISVTDAEIVDSKTVGGLIDLVSERLKLAF